MILFYASLHQVCVALAGQKLDNLPFSYLLALSMVYNGNNQVYAVPSVACNAN